MADPHDAAAHVNTRTDITFVGHDHDGTPETKLLAANTHESPSADTHHAKVHGDAEHPVMGRMMVIRKTADETISLNQVSQNDDELFFAVGANEVWIFNGVLVFNSGTVEDFKFNATGPAGSTGFHAAVSGTGSVTFALGTDSNTISAAAADRALAITGAIENGGTAGNLNIQWAQALSGATNCIVREHSFLIAHRVA